MDISSFLTVLFMITILIPIMTLVLYGIMLLFYTNKKTLEHRKVYEDPPDVTILIPSYNEEKIMDKRIKNLLNYTYPMNKMKIIFIDDSNDTTPDIIKSYVNNYDNLKLMHFNERMGYSKAIQEGLKEVDTDIVVLNESGSFPKPIALMNQINRFQDEDIGAVTGKSIILNINEKTGKIEGLYLKILDFIRTAESKMDTTIIIKGEATAYRTKLVKDIKASQDAGSIDTSMAFLVRKQGYKTVFDPNVVFEEYAPSDREGFVKQKRVRAANIMRNLIIFKDMLFNKNYGKFGMISLPFYFIIFFIAPLLLPVAFIILLMGIMNHIALFINLSYFIMITFIIIVFFARNFLTLLFNLELSMLRALYQIFITRKGHDKIDRVESTRRI